MNNKMKISDIEKIKIKDLVKGYILGSAYGVDEGVMGWNGALTIRPKYQREFIYGDTNKKQVIDTVLKGFPLNVFYFVKNKNKDYEVLDGQQRILSICEYYVGEFSIDLEREKNVYFNDTSSELKRRFEEYELSVYICEGDEREKLDWFERINIAGKPLKMQEMRNAIYSGDFTLNVKKHFSKKNNCPAELEFGNFIPGERDRQDYLEKFLGWYVNLLNRHKPKEEKTSIERYMSENRSKDGKELIEYFYSLKNWVKNILLVEDYLIRAYWNGIEWGILYNEYKNIYDKKVDNVFINRVKELQFFEDIESKKNILEFVLGKEADEKLLKPRLFKPKEKERKWTEQEQICVICDNGKKLTLEETHADHIIPISKGGKTEYDNLQIICIKHNLQKGSKK